MGGLLYFEGRRMTLGGDVRKIVDFGSGGCFLSTGRENLTRGEHPHERAEASTGGKLRESAPGVANANARWQGVVDTPFLKELL